MEDYYRRRAKEYEEIYYRDDPARQQEQREIATALKRTLRDRRVLEIACGTGYWTKILSETAQSICATDVAQEVLEIAKRKKYGCPVLFCIEDAYNLSFKDSSFDGGLASFWFSHIPRKKIESFLRSFHRVLQTGSRVFIADNVHVPGMGGQLITIEGDKDTYKLRRLKDGSEHPVLKNYFSLEELVKIFGRHVKGFGNENIVFGDCFWFLIYELG